MFTIETKSETGNVVIFEFPNALTRDRVMELMTRSASKVSIVHPVTVEVVKDRTPERMAG